MYYTKLVLIIILRTHVVEILTSFSYKWRFLGALEKLYVVRLWASYVNILCREPLSYPLAHVW